MNTDIESLRYPIGKHEFIKEGALELKDVWIDAIDQFPSLVEKLIINSSQEQLNWPYRPNGWTVEQLVHHCLDSHMNSLIRFKWVLTEEEPTIKPYFEDRWIHLADVKEQSISQSLDFLKLLHQKWVVLLKSLSILELNRKYRHPEHNKELDLLQTISMYAWHCNHHLAHMKQGLNSEGKYI